MDVLQPFRLHTSDTSFLYVSPPLKFTLGIESALLVNKSCTPKHRKAYLPVNMNHSSYDTTGIVIG